MTDKEMLKKCLDAFAKGSIVGVTLTTIVAKDGEIIDVIDESSRQTNKARVVLRTDGVYMHLDLEFSEAEDIDLKGIQYIYEQYLDSSMEYCMQNGEITEGKIVKTAGCVFDVVGSSDEYTCQMSLFSPLFASREDATYRLVFKVEDVRFGVDEADGGTDAPEDAITLD